MADSIAYAENTLGVHEVWKRTEERLEQHRLASGRRSEALIGLRTVRDAQTDREAELVTTNRGVYAELSETAFKARLKEIVHADPVHKGLRDRERNLQATLDSADAELDHHQKGLQALSARMVELGGLLNFYAAAKQASITTTSS